jgi:hypothetical protein
VNDPDQNLVIVQDDEQDDDGNVEVTPAFLSFSRRAFEIWRNDMSAEHEAERIKGLVLDALRGDGDEYGSSSHMDGPASRRREQDRDALPHTQSGSTFESDAQLLMDRYPARAMSRKELQAAADRLAGRREDAAIERVISVRLAKNLMGHHE